MLQHGVFDGMCFSFVGKTFQNNHSMTQLSHDKFILAQLVQKWEIENTCFSHSTM